MKPQAETARPKPAVCRRLFADDDDDDGPVEEGLRDNMFNQITEQINRNLDDACKKYNFDFRSEMPLEGDWSWERLTPDTAPHATSAPPVPGPDTAPAPPETPTPPLQPPTDPLQPPSVPQ